MRVKGKQWEWLLVFMDVCQTINSPENKIFDINTETRHIKWNQHIWDTSMFYHILCSHFLQEFTYRTLHTVCDIYVLENCKQSGEFWYHWPFKIKYIA